MGICELGIDGQPSIRIDKIKKRAAKVALLNLAVGVEPTIISPFEA